MTCRAVLFDAAETLFTLRGGSIGEIYAEVARRFGSEAPASEIDAAFVRQFQHSGPVTTESEKQWWKDVVHRVFTEVGMIRDFDGFFGEVYERFRDSRGWKLFPETRQVVEQLKSRGVPLGVISNFDSRIYTVMESLGILSFFDAVTISSEAGYAKPHPKIFATAIHRIGVPAGETLFAGDSLVDDYQAGKAAGLQAVLVDRAGRYAGMKSIRRIASLVEIL
jgi:putative hydrolase of the HAD superfamily